LFPQVRWQQTSFPINIMNREAVSKSWLPTALAVAGGAAAMIFLTNRGKKKDTDEAPAKPRVYDFLPIEGHAFRRTCANTRATRSEVLDHCAIPRYEPTRPTVPLSPFVGEHFLVFFFVLVDSNRKNGITKLIICFQVQRLSPVMPDYYRILVYSINS